MKARTAFSTRTGVTEAVAEIRSQLKDAGAAMVVFFASPEYEPERVAAAMAEAFPGVVTFGCTTAGEIVTGKMLEHSLVAMALGTDAVKSVKVEVLPELEKESFDAFASFERHFGVKVSEMDPERYVGLLLIDGLSTREELILDRIGDLTNVSFVGGSAGDDLEFHATYVFADGKSYTNAAVLAILEPTVPFSVLKTQSFVPEPKKFVVTKANEAQREVLELDGRPAAVVYAEAVGVPVEKAQEQFMEHPVGLVFEGEPFVRSPQRVNNGGIVFYCAVKEGMELSLLSSTDIIADTQAALESVRAERGKISAIISFNCILRTLELRQKGLTEQYGEIFAEVPTVGFSTYGEQYIGHLNQTATMLLLH